MNFISQFFKDILDNIFLFVGNYGWSVVLFTCLIKLILLPLDIKSKKGMRDMTRIQPKLQALQVKYANDKEKMNQKMQELYRKEKVSPTAGCLPLLIQLPILWFMFSAMRVVANEHTIQMLLELMNNGSTELQSWLWIKNVFQPDSFMSAILPGAQAVTSQFSVVSGSQWLTQENIDAVKAFLTTPEYKTILASFGGNNFITVPLNFLITTVNLTVPNSFKALFSSANGLLILPILAAASQFLMTQLQSGKQQPQPNNAAGAQNPAAGMNSGFMKWFFPIFSLWICASSNAAFAIYWMAVNVIQIVEQKVIDVILDNKEKKKQASEITG